MGSCKGDFFQVVLFLSKAPNGAEIM